MRLQPHRELLRTPAIASSGTVTAVEATVGPPLHSWAQVDPSQVADRFDSICKTYWKAIQQALHHVHASYTRSEAAYRCPA
jgi:hypothetical protein